MNDAPSVEFEPNKVPPPTPRVLDERWLDPRRLKKTTTLMSCLFYGAVLNAFLSADSMAHTEKLLGTGSRPLGLPLWVSVVMAVTLACAPLPFAFGHLFRLVFQGAAEGGSIGTLAIIRSVFTMPRHHPELRRSRTIVVLILGGYIAAMFTYAFIADEREIAEKRRQREALQHR